MFQRASAICRPSLLAALLLVAGGPAPARVHSLTGNVRYQVGHELPLPITFGPAPNGAIHEISGATIHQHPVPSLVLTQMGMSMMMPTTSTSTLVPGPSRVVLDPGQLAVQASPRVQAVFPANMNLFQLHTSISVQFPASQISFAGLGRTGAATVTFCHGSVVTAKGNPACLTGAGAIPGLLRYTRTSHQFGGPARVGFSGAMTYAAAGASAPCTGCLAFFAGSTPPARPALGGAFGVSTAIPHPPPDPGLFFVTVNTAGLIVGITPTGQGPGLANPQASFGGPWTTGMLTVSQPSLTTPQVFVFSGSDARTANGAGSLSLVAGGMVQRSLTGPAAVRGWLNLQIGPALSQVPLMSPHAAATLALLISLAGLRGLRRVRASRSTAPAPETLLRRWPA